MYISDQYQIQWWLPPRTASRMTKSIITKLGFEVHQSHHSVFSDCKYDVYLNIRNPYSIAASIFFMKEPREYMSFKDFVIKGRADFLDSKNLHQVDYTEATKIQNSNIKKLIRYENYRDDILSIDFIQENIHLIQEEMKEFNLGTSPWRGTNKWHNRVPYNQIYTQEIADLVYEYKKNYFEFGGYERNSWKTIID